MPERKNRSDLVFAKDYPPKIAWYDSLDVYKDLVTLFENANKNLLKNDFGLIEHDVSERTVCAALMLHLNRSLWGTPFCSYRIDVEYNRNKDGIVKAIIDHNEVVTNITCDLIVHSRGNYIEQDNLIALEMKKARRKKNEKQKDKDRLLALTKDRTAVWCYDGATFPEHVCRYILGIYYEIDINNNWIYLEYYHHGELVDLQTIVI